MDAVYAAMGRPASAAEYGLKVADGAPEWLGKFAGDLGNTLFPLGASKAQVEAVGKLMNDSFAGVLTAENDAKAARIAETETALKGKFGAEFDAAKGRIDGLLKSMAGDKAGELAERLNLHFGDMPFMFEALNEIAKGRAEPGAPVLPGGAPPGVAGYANVAAAEAALRAFDADKDNAAAINDRNSVNRVDVINKRFAIIEAITALKQTKAV